MQVLVIIGQNAEPMMETCVLVALSNSVIVLPVSVIVSVEINRRHYF